MFQALPENLLVRLWKSTRIDFSEIRIYKSEIPVWLGVPALACGSSLLFAPGFYDPNAPKGRRLILHELMHCVQQWSGKLKGRSGVITDDVLEGEANSFNICTEAVVRPSTLTRKLPFFLPEPLVYQPAIGFEFQTGWKAYRRSTVLHRLNFPEKRDIKLPKETSLYGGRHTGLGWSMETDDDEIEFVIEPPLEESYSGLIQLERVFNSLRSFASRLEFHRTSQELTPKSHPEFFNPGVDSSFVIKPNGDFIKAQPQITLGVRLGRVPDLFEEMSRLRQVSNVGLFESQGLKSDYFAGQAKTVAGLVANLPPINGTPASNKLRGLVALVCQYLIQGSSGGSRSYVKDLAYAMARTDFASMFNLLLPAESKWFKTNPQRWVDYCLGAAQMPNTGQKLLVQSKITDGVVGRPGSRPEYQLQLTRQDWLIGMAQGVDRLTRAGTPNLFAADGSHRLRALGLLGFTVDPVGRARQNGTRHKGVILELRRMQRDVPLARWAVIARQVLLYLINLNNTHAADLKPHVDIQND